mmetsp:Transcript_36013/g.84088  ORF Transcript_36013/g.84088 Transcript_36013/m.84088 type:complete len:88 (+) Transcript_36013:181-444(+)|eukprot:CAMPEP_0113302752 /NCGR_PEP_ID=MMETSP0010_2-20120614/3451_1 /TAXON_ID=216773 ORGANISM="Corethron hystrix, Strain 308" /NCGR_SAMPLE_ID=MMETSP0010_2 /ASSEMBLY_ACC=CAM_ASM_000155 /LENGTH=87 /DNA_ID=CAMNT_0000156629 /DNA_START=103 /DNA_END=366 /DNA_ORIENTATION=+ /assembly_acc=CAM_ASM_000155
MTADPNTALIASSASASSNDLLQRAKKAGCTPSLLTGGSEGSGSFEELATRVLVDLIHPNGKVADQHVLRLRPDAKVADALLFIKVS